MLCSDQVSAHRFVLFCFRLHLWQDSLLVAGGLTSRYGGEEMAAKVLILLARTHHSLNIVNDNKAQSCGGLVAKVGSVV